MRTLLHDIAQEEIPESEDLLSQEALETYLDALGDPPLTLIAVGDIMLGGRASKAIARYGDDYPFQAVLPLLRRANVVLGNLEGPFAHKAGRESRHYAYAVNPKLASSLARAGISVVTLANNHLLDCGRGGVVETLDALARAGVAPLGAAANESAAHAPVIRQVGQIRIGLLGYYWNRRCAATAHLPGCAVDSPEALKNDILHLRPQVDRVVVTFHWGVPYERQPVSGDRAKAQYAIDCGADAVIGHHPHILQPIEIYAQRPILYSIGNFTFGSGNSRGEGMVAGFRFEEEQILLMLYPLYVKNRDPRVNYQPKILKGNGAERIVSHLRAMSELSGSCGYTLSREQARAVLRLPCPGTAHKKRGT
ncbi:capsular polysaccharide biosynthesis protein [Reticulibacter mediterranei]|uniref:Capsular polysaccharide biosynthesis protein n=1 Tax=Reticulibacter mediterranei TaxID=2778369 RepID=A0A8J3IF96_9CHLR|nr:CapA family protein [Reticulibacter mediterranei]GHO90139.1 capsular polysaccharide biosynthesis protein [Reticulibacter mediterranei]